MRDLEYTIQDAFQGSTLYYSISNGSSGPQGILQDNAMFRCYMEVPLDGDTIEIPAFMLKELDGVLRGCNKENAPYPDKVAVPLYSLDSYVRYKSLDCIMNIVLRCNFVKNRLVPIKASNCDRVYYGTLGAVFNDHFLPMAMQTWTAVRATLEKGQESEREGFILKRPNLWVNPAVYMEREDAVQRFIVNRMMKAIAGYRVAYYNRDNLCILSRDRDTQFMSRVIVDYIPFKLKFVDTPSVSTDDKQLLDLALKYKDEITRYMGEIAQ